MLSDRELLYNLFDNDPASIRELEKMEDKDLNLCDAQWKYIPDRNNQVYTQNVINFDTDNIKNVWADFHSGYFLIPLLVTSTGTALTLRAQVAIKQSLLSIIHSLILKINEKGVLNTTNLEFINNLRCLIEKDLVWYNNEGRQIFFRKEHNVRTDANDICEIVAADDIAATPNFQKKNPTYNKGFFERVSLLIGMHNYENNAPTFQQPFTNSYLNAPTAPASAGAYGPTVASNWLSTSNGFQVLAYIPLKLIHDFFDKLAFPVINLRMEMNVTTSMASDCPYPPVGVGFLTTSTTGNLTTAERTCTVTVSPNLTFASNVKQCRLYYRNLVFQPKIAMMIAERLKGGIKKKFSYIESQTYVNPTAHTTSTNIDEYIPGSTVAPTRVWFLAYPAGALVAQTNNSPGYTQPCNFTSANIQINTKPYYDSPLQTEQDFWNEIKAQFKNMDENTSILNLQDYRSNYRGMICFDLSRLHAQRLLNPLQKCELIVNIVRTDTVDIDKVYIVEKEEQCEINMSSASVDIKNGAVLQ